MTESGESQDLPQRELDRTVRIAEDAEQKRRDLETCWLCGGPTLAIHCKIVCPRCGFRRDCSDP